uniref:Uncharacterized protein n=1 Tax=Ananas comosus var. bracteatus TaxID=296719 RepID=A0A6V7Q5B1_ANACO|nr:unnamed protein product [Ananas comosus var. bracteatus]
MKSFAQSLSKSHVAAGLLAGFFLVLLITYFSMSEQFAIRVPNLFWQPSTEHEVVSIPSAQDVGSNDAVKEIKASRNETEPKSENFKKEEEIKEEKKTPESLNSTKQLGSKDAVEETKASRDEPEPKSENFKKEKEIKEEKKTPESLENTQQLGKGNEKSNQPVKLKPVCNTTNPRCDVCDMTGDARILGSNSTVLYVPPPEITNPEPQDPPCTVRHNVPAVVFALGGLIGNTWHDFSDVIVPLYLTSRQFNGEVQFVITDLAPWWVKKYSVILKKLSRYEIIDFDSDKEIHCYPRAVVGLWSHRDFGILPDSPPEGYTMLDFRLFMREAYSLPKDVPISYRDKPEKKPRLMLINRGKTRRWMNVEEIAKSVEG